MFNLMNEHEFKIKTNGEEMVRLAEGITSAEPDLNEELAQDAYMNHGGFGSTDVIGAQLIITFSGHRNYDDPAQNYIYSKSLDLGTGRRTEFEWEEPDGGVFSGDCTIANISGPSGDAGAKGEISFEMHFNGKPDYTPPNGATSTTTTTNSDDKDKVTTTTKVEDKTKSK